MIDVFIDIETYCHLDIKKVSTHKYAKHSEILIVCWAYKSGEPKVWDCLEKPQMPVELKRILENTKYRLWTHNASFERLHLAPERMWYCTQVLAMYHSMKPKLKDCTAIADLPSDKQKDHAGKVLVNRFSKPRKPSKNNPNTRFWPEDDLDKWQKFIDYCKQDVVSCRAFYEALDRYPGKSFWEEYKLDQQINDRGLPLDYSFINKAIDIIEKKQKSAFKQIQDITKVDNPNSLVQIKTWLVDTVGTGETFSCLDADHVKFHVTREDLPEEAIRVLKLRQLCSAAAVKKYYAMKNIANLVNGNWRLQDCFFFYGASRTGRWGGQFMQPQNMRKGYSSEQTIDSLRILIEKDKIDLVSNNAFDTLADLVRSSIRAEPNKDLVVSDLSSIESCVIAWLTDCKSMLNIFRQRKSMYRVFASKFFNVKYSEVTKKQRNFSKPPTLGCGFGLGWFGLQNYAEGYGQSIVEKESRKAVDLFRNLWPEIPSAWKIITSTFMKVIQSSSPISITIFNGKITVFKSCNKYVWVKLPSGRCLCYIDCKIVKKKTPWGEFKPTVSYMYMDQVTKAWIRIFTHGGKLIENIVQAIARDILVHGMKLLSKRGIRIYGHVHDEVITQVWKSFKGARKIIEDCLTFVPKWASGLPLAAKSYRGKYFRKD